MKTLLEVFDPAMCCSTGVCGPDVDPKLVHFSADLDWLKSQGVEVRRYNLAHQSAEFVRKASIKELLAKSGTGALPAIVVDGRLVSQAIYPSRAELASMAGVAMLDGKSAKPGLAALSREFVSLGAAVATNCERCFEFHHAELVKMGVSVEEISAAVQIAQQVKMFVGDNFMRMAHHVLEEKSSASSDCCGVGESVVQAGIKIKNKTACCGS
ncbi:MAG: arsenite efflux transporter metallochaperone ArsD [Phycisphaerae bacterium]